MTTARVRAAICFRVSTPDRFRSCVIPASKIRNPPIKRRPLPSAVFSVRNVSTCVYRKCVPTGCSPRSRGHSLIQQNTTMYEDRFTGSTKLPRMLRRVELSSWSWMGLVDRWRSTAWQVASIRIARHDPTKSRPRTPHSADPANGAYRASEAASPVNTSSTPVGPRGLVASDTTTSTMNPSGIVANPGWLNGAIAFVGSVL
jgi:hypothetical protein